MKKHILTILAIALIFGAMLASVQTVYAASEPEGCIAFTSAKEFTVSLGPDKSWDGTIQVSVNGTDWQDYTAGTAIDSEKSPNGEHSVFFRGEGNSQITDFSKPALFQLTEGEILCSGNIENLLDHTIVQENKHPEMSKWAFSGLFNNCRSLTTAPELPATTLAYGCYSRMFSGCRSLTTAPELPAMTLAYGCYSGMFYDCRSLTTAPELPATTLAAYCYNAMFYGCESLTMAPALPATALADSCYELMFMGSGVKISEKKGISNGVFYGIPYRIPEKGKGTAGSKSLEWMFHGEGASFQNGTPDLNTTYYLAVPDWTNRGRENKPIVISDTIGWSILSDFVKDGFSMEGLFFKLGADIEVTTTVGENQKPFSGSFDGDGKTLTFSPDDAPEYCAPFAYTNNAKFKNLHTAGTIKTDHQYAAGLIGHADGRDKITNCRCSIIIDSSVNGDGSHGGFIAGGGADFEGCVFDGKLLGPKTTLCGGFLGWASPEGACSFKNCLFAPQELDLKGPLDIFSRHVTAETPIENCYYTKNIDRKQGIAGRTITADKGITVGSADAAVYSVSGITAFDMGLIYGDVFYAGIDKNDVDNEKPDQIPVTIPSACDGITASAGTLTGEGTAFTLTMPDEDVTLALNKGANHQWETEYTVDKEATCSEEGSESIHCSVCKEINKDTVRAIKKTAHNYSDWKVTKDATCTEDGSKEKVCSACGDKVTETITAQGHQWKDATCTEPKTCTVCQEKEGDALGHAWGAWTPLDENQHQRVCENDSSHTEKAGHAWNEGVVTREATTEEAGEILFTCGDCRATRTESIPVLDIDPITPSDVTADTAPVDPGIPVIDADRITTAGNFTRKEMRIIFPADAAVTNYRVQYRKAGDTDWQAGWSEGTDTYIIHDLAKASLCEFRIAGFVKLEDGSWARSEWSDISYRYMRAVKLRSAKAGKKSIKLTWAKDKKGSGYQIKYFTDKNIHMADADTVTIKGKKKTKYTIKPLQKGQTYYVRIRPTKVRNGIEYIGILKNTKKAKVK